MADLFSEIEARMRVARAYERWKRRRPWSWFPTRIRAWIFTRFFAEREMRSFHG